MLKQFEYTKYFVQATPDESDDGEDDDDDDDESDDEQTAKTCALFWAFSSKYMSWVWENLGIDNKANL